MKAMYSIVMYRYRSIQISLDRYLIIVLQKYLDALAGRARALESREGGCPREAGRWRWVGLGGRLQSVGRGAAAAYGPTSGRFLWGYAG